MKKMAVLRITLLFLLVRGLYAQTPIQDVSEKGGPLVLGPSVTADEYYDWNVTAQNVSEKEILAYAVNFDELVTRRDLYFGKDHPSFSSKSTQVIMELPGAPKPSTIRAVVTWVQFADGTEWGDPKAGEELLRNRAASLLFYSQALDVYNKDGDAAFTALLSKIHDESNMVGALSDHLLKMSAPDAVQHIQEKLAAAERHDKLFAAK